MAVPQVGAVGLLISVTLKDQDQAPLDVTTTTARTIYLRRPNGRVTACPATVIGPGTDGRIGYVTLAGDLDVPGDWRIQARVITGTSSDYFSDIQPFRVAENIAP